jgi:hypothetical protein
MAVALQAARVLSSRWSRLRATGRWNLVRGSFEWGLPYVACVLVTKYQLETAGGAVPMRCGDVLAFHHNTMHGSEGFSRERHVRWSIDLRYGPAGQPFDWHGDPFWLEKWPPFRARAANPDECVDTWEQWEARWRNPHQLAAAL